MYSGLRTSRIAVVKSWLYDEIFRWLFGNKPPNGLQLIAKACWESASIGLSADSVGSMSLSTGATQERSQSLRQPLIVQVFVRGYKVEVPLLDLGNGPSALEAVSITLDRNPKLDDRILDYEIVYHDGFYFPFRSLGSNR